MNRKSAAGLLVVVILSAFAAGLIWWMGERPLPIIIVPEVTYHAPKATPESPKRLIIPKLNINTAIEAVGIDTQGLMETPKKPEEVAWYKLGATPGTTGNAVIAGHYDSATGPAVFYGLGTLSAGDEVFVLDEKNQQWKFRVEKTESYNAENFPVDTVFAQSEKSELNLVTCDGILDSSNHAYTKRLVVYTTNVKSF